MNTLKTIGRNAVLFAIGGTIYYMIELIWRGYSSLPMVLVGGLCFLFCGSINEFLGWDEGTVEVPFFHGGKVWCMREIDLLGATHWHLLMAKGGSYAKTGGLVNRR